MRYRTETDSIGSREVPENAYYGIQSMRAAENFRMTGLHIHPEMIRSMADEKAAVAVTNYETGALDEEREKVILRACAEMKEGRFDSEIIVDPIQGGAGTSLNMNVNEVLANRAIELLGGIKGDYKRVHPNDHINMSQSTNDVFPTAGKIAACRLVQKAEKELRRLHKALEEKSVEFYPVIKMGRTQLQDAVPIRLGQEFASYAAAVGRDIRRMETAAGEMRTSNLDPFAAVSGSVKACAVTLSKIASDLRLMSSGPRTGLGEILLPGKQNGSSIMPGKVNPVISEVVNQAAFQIFGNDVTITLAAESGQLELNAFEPVIFYNLFQAVDLLGHAAATFTDNCICGIQADAARCKAMVENSVGTATALCPYLGYTKAAEIAKKAVRENRNLRELVLEERLMDEEELDRVLDPYAMTEPGIPGKMD
ncbi:aspartate ammonia-lyase [Lachnoclostridium sp. An196]|uniref:aspartate ammonia-lyase n=1 Tax=Lachnoclostridium sp. An196 TaxID=1965583 RepID=UPI000B386AB5|nr:aspartate ammonia-lyase [Lachnoclostridium sp. An196]